MKTRRAILTKVVSRKDAKGAKAQRRFGNEIRALNFAIYSLPLCVFAPFASLRETLRFLFQLTESFLNIYVLSC